MIRGVDIGDVERDRDQIWAETYQMFLGGADWWVNEESDEAHIFRKEKKGHFARAKAKPCFFNGWGD